MGRLERKYWNSDKLGILNKGGLLDLFDNQIKIIYRITDDEYDHACEILNDDELGLFTTMNDLTFAQKRKILEILNSKIYNKEARL